DRRWNTTRSNRRKRLRCLGRRHWSQSRWFEIYHKRRAVNCVTGPAPMSKSILATVREASACGLLSPLIVPVASVGGGCPKEPLSGGVFFSCKAISFQLYLRPVLKALNGRIKS